MTTAEQAKSLLNELHKDRLSYDEYTLLFDAIAELQERNAELENGIKVIVEAVERVKRAE